MTEACIIQRYMDLGKFERLLKDKALFLTKMSVFDDKLEGGLTAADYIRNSNDAYDFDIAINFSWPSFDETQEQRYRRGEEARAANTKVRAREFETPFGKYKSDNIQELFPLCRELIYVSCWHKSQYECSAMWQIYGSDNNSICIISTLDRLKNSIQKVDSLNSLLFAETDYIDHDDAKFSDDTLAPFKSKSLPYSFEKELRVIGFNSNINLNDVLLNDEKGVNIPISSLSKLIEKIIISPHSDSDFIGQVKEMCVSFGLESKVEHSKLRRKPIDDFFSAMKGLEKGNV